MKRSNLVLLDDAERDAQTIDFRDEKKSWQDWNAYAKELTQALAKRLRGYSGPSTEDDTPTGGTPILMRQAA